MEQTEIYTLSMQTNSEQEIKEIRERRGTKTQQRKNIVTPQQPKNG